MGVRLPSEYQEVEYLESTGVEYIDTEIIADDTTGFFIDGRKKIGTSTDDVIIGSRSGTNSRFWADIGRISVQNNRFLLGWNGYHNTNIDIGTNRFSISVNYNNDRKVYVNGVENAVGTNALTNPLYVQTASIYLFAANNQGSASGPINGQIFVCRITRGSVLSADFIPCYRKSDSKPGMYDLVSGEFFTNQGTGEFLVGNDVIDSISPWLMARRRALMARKPFDCPYVKDGLVFWLDGIRKGDDPTVWKDLVRGIAFDMSGVTFTTNGVEFVSGSYGAYDGNIAVAWDVGTIEACVDYASYQTAILSQKSYSPTPLSLINGTGANVGYAADGQARPRGNATYGWKTLSVNADLVVRNGTSVGFGTNDSWTVNPDRYTYLGIRRSDLSSYRFTGTMYAIRIYNRKLTEQEMIFNQSVDNNRFNLGLNI